MSCKREADWPDWRGESVVIVATGPSAIDARSELVTERCRIIAIKGAWHLCPWADVLYGSDRAWWVDRKGVPEFTGLKITASPAAAKLCGLRSVQLELTEQILRDEIGVVGCGSRRGGGHSGFHALNLAVQFGAERIALVGMDMSNGHSDTEIHRVALDVAIKQLASEGVAVRFGLWS